MTEYVKWGLIAVGVYLLYKMFSGAKTAVTAAQSAAASSIADLFPNNVLIRPTGGFSPDGAQQFSVTMKDGSTQIVNAGGVPVTNPANAPLDTSLMADFSNAGNF